MSLSDATPHLNPELDELLCHSEQTRVFRRRQPDGLGSFIYKELLGNEAIERKRHESRILSRLAGIDGIPRQADVTSPDNVLVLEDWGGIALNELTHEDSQDWLEFLDFAIQLTRIIAAVHRAGVVHKDINPNNILAYGTPRTPMLIDFSIATTFAEERPGFMHHGKIAGTLAYLAPEQTGRTGRAVDQRADFYSLGATLYELAIGHPPFQETDLLQLLHRHLAQEPTPPAALHEEVPAGLSDIIMRLLEKEPDRRYQSAEGLAHDLTQLREMLAKGENARLTLGKRDFPLRLVAPSRPIGRKDEIDALRQAFDNALSGGNRGFLVSGPAGVGKSTIINELRPIVTTRHGWFVAGKFDQYRQDIGSDAVRQALRALGNLLLAEPQAELARLRAYIMQSLGPNAELIAAVLPEFALLMGVAPEAGAELPPNVEERLIRGGVDLLRAVASRARPVLMVIDDLQWAAATPVDFVDALLLDETLEGVFLVGAYREDEIDPTHPLSAKLSRWERLGAAPPILRLKNLPPADLGTLLNEMMRLGAESAARLAEAVTARTKGNPYETVELINALRRDGTLVPGEEGWTWDETEIRQHIGQGDLVDLLCERIDKLPAESRELLHIMACLGGELEMGLLRAASQYSTVVLEAHLAPALDDGLLVLEQGREASLRFRHDRVQQAAFAHLAAASPSSTSSLRLVLARRLATVPELTPVAAQQYLPAVDEIRDPEERRRVAALFQIGAEYAGKLANYVMVERFLEAAFMLLTSLGTSGDDPLLTAVETERHAALYNLGRLEEADMVFASIMRRNLEPLDLAGPVCVQINSLTNRGRPKEALDLGFTLLRQFGWEVPEGDFAAIISQRAEEFYRWVETISLEEDLKRPEVNDPRIVAIAKVANHMMPPAVFSDPMVLAWLVFDSQRMWAEYGPFDELVFRLSHAAVVTIAVRDDYLAGSRTTLHVLALSEARGYEPAASLARFLVSVSALHWSKPLQEVLPLARLAHEGLVRAGVLQMACFAYYPSAVALLHCSPTLDAFGMEVETCLSFAERTGNDQAMASFFANRQLLRALYGQTVSPGSFADSTFDEGQYVERYAQQPMALFYFHSLRALTAVLFGDIPTLVEQSAKAMPLLEFMQSFYPYAMAHLLRALALAAQIRLAASDDPPHLLAELDTSLQWLASRAADAPDNFLHLVQLVEAERAWALGDFQTAARAFDKAHREVQAHPRPWHRALIAGHTADFYQSHGMLHVGETLLAEARDHYQAWGATGVVSELERKNPFLKSTQPFQKVTKLGSTIDISTESIDLLAIVRASQALSSETSLSRLKARVVDLLGAMTGASNVILTVRDEASSKWFLASAENENHAPLLSVEQAGACGQMPLAAFRYVERTQQALLVDDATRDDRFANDPYFAELEQCSLMIVPIQSQGILRAILLLENRFSHGAFSPDRLDAVMLVAGQLAVSLQNVLLYASLERKVADRTEELARSLSLVQATLEAATDGILTVDLLGKPTAFSEKLLEMWRLPREVVESGDDQEMLKIALQQVTNPEQFLSKVEQLYATPEMDSFDLLELTDGRVYERYSKPQRVGERCVGRVWSFRDITERKRAEAELERINLQLREASRMGGMAEIATNVLHNVGNALNSVNVSAQLVIDRTAKSKVRSLEKLAALLLEHQNDMADFVTNDPRGQKLTEYLPQLSGQLLSERNTTVSELQLLLKNIEHIREIVAMQQNYARVYAVRESIEMEDLLEDALRMNADSLNRHGVGIIREYEEVPTVNADKHKILQVLVNLIRNAKQACKDSDQKDKRITLRLKYQDSYIKITVADNGVGIPPENLTRIFNHGFTTRKDGSGFGLHSSALAAKEMGGSLIVTSPGIGQGAEFTFELPYGSRDEKSE